MPPFQPPNADAFEPMARCVLDYLDGHTMATMRVLMEDGETEELSPTELLRSDGLSDFDAQALELAGGRVLDVGAGAGPHTLNLAARGFDVTALETSPTMRRVLHLRGVEKILDGSLEETVQREVATFDTLLFMMNGLGITGRYASLSSLLRQCADLLAPGGRIIADTSDLRQSPDHDEVRRIALRQASGRQPGEAEFQLIYDGGRSAQKLIGKPFDWLYAEPRRLAAIAEEAGLQCTIIDHDGDGGYLVVLD